MGISLISDIIPKNGGAFPTHSAIYGKGGFQSRANATDRDNIPDLNREEGMHVYVIDEDKVYRLGAGLTNLDWVEETTLPVGIDGYAIQSIVWKPGTTTTANHVATWEEVEAFIANSEQPAPLIVYVDDSIDPGNIAEIPATADTDCLGQVWFVAANPRSWVGTTYMWCADGGQIKNPAGFIGISIWNWNTIKSPILIDAAADIVTVTFGGPCWHWLDNTATVSTFSVTNGTVQFSNDGDELLFNQLPGIYLVPHISIEAGSTCSLFCKGMSSATYQIPENLVEGDASTTFYFIHSARATFVTQSLFSGTLDLIRLDRAENIQPSTGTTANRPTNPVEGEMYFDTDLGSPVWWNGADWILSEGVPDGSDGYVQFNSSGAFGADPGLTYNSTTNVLSVGDAINIGGSTSTTGTIRLPSNFSIVAPQGAGAAQNSTIFAIDANKHLYIGDITSGYVENIKAEVNGYVHFGCDGLYVGVKALGNNATYFSATPTEITAPNPIIGEGISATGPYSVHGRKTVTGLTNANHTMGYTEHIYDWIDFTGQYWQSAHSIIFPHPSSIARGYYKTITNSTDGYVITVSTGTGTTCTLAIDRTQRFFFDSTGVNYAGVSFAEATGDITTDPGGLDGYVQFNDGGVFGGDAGLSYNKTTNVLSISDALAIGASPALTGAIRLTDTNIIKGEYVGVDWNLLEWNSGVLSIGDNVNSSLPTIVQSKSQVALQINSSYYLECSSSAIKMLYPIVGNGVQYGCHGVGTQPMADTNQTPSSSVYKYVTIVTTGTLTADRTLTLPAATDAAGYTKWIDNTCVGDYAIIVGDGGAGTTVRVANGTRVLVQFDSRGASAGILSSDHGGSDLTAAYKAAHPGEALVISDDGSIIEAAAVVDLPLALADIDPTDGLDGYVISLVSSVPTWTPVASGIDTYVQFNNGGNNLGGDAGLTYDSVNNILSIGSAITIGSNVPSYGQIRLPKDCAINMTEDLGSNYYTAISDGGSAGFAQLSIGYDGQGGSYNTPFPNVTISPTTSAKIKINNSLKLDVQSNITYSVNPIIGYLSKYTVHGAYSVVPDANPYTVTSSAYSYDYLDVKTGSWAGTGTLYLPNATLAGAYYKTIKNDSDYLLKVIDIDDGYYVNLGIGETARVIVTDTGVALASPSDTHALATFAMDALEIDWAKTNTFSKTLADAENTITFANNTDGRTIVVVFTGGGASCTVVWPTIKWAGGTPPTQTPSGIDVYTFVMIDSTIYGSAIQAMA